MLGVSVTPKAFLAALKAGQKIIMPKVGPHAVWQPNMFNEFCGWGKHQRAHQTKHTSVIWLSDTPAEPNYMGAGNGL
jgi:hypothetical protein